MTRRERLMAIYRGGMPDRPAVRLWRAQPSQPPEHPAYHVVFRAAMEKSDVVADSGADFDIYAGVHEATYFHREEYPTASSEWVNIVTRVDTPQGPLQGTFRKSTCGKPGYDVEYLLKTPEDIEKLLSIPYEPFPFSDTQYRSHDAQVGDSGIVLFNLDHAMYALQRAAGSENFALWSLTHDDLLLDAIQTFADRINEQVTAALDGGLRPVFGWVGPELCIPPLMPVSTFDRYVFDFDQPLIERIHDAGCYVWVHCHGKMSPVIERFMKMGVDVLNPIEPPPMGDLTLEQAFSMVGNRMGLEGNIETHDLLTQPPHVIARKVHEAIEAGKDHRFILCISSSYMEEPNPSDLLIQNLLTFVEEGVLAAESVRTR